uniref:Uncharacterized protein n=1 Tax=Rhizophora mucronata TaxID=61149 RepID=A0A2P2QKI1_RHIMU
MGCRRRIQDFSCAEAANHGKESEQT